jgi:diguanylate cyclase (GGDEF)-like protein
MPTVLIWGESRTFAAAARRRLKDFVRQTHVVNGHDPRTAMRAVERHAPDVLVVEPEGRASSLKTLLQGLSSMSLSPGVLLVSEDGSGVLRSLGAGRAPFRVEVTDADSLPSAVAATAASRRHRVEKEELEREVQLYKTLTAVAKDLEWEGLLTSIMDGAMEVSRAAMGALLVHHPERNRVDVAEIRGVSKDKTPHGAMGFPMSVLRRVMESGKPERAAPRMPGFRPRRIGAKIEVDTACLLPVTAGQETAGVLVLLWDARKSPFTSRNERLTREFLSQCADFLHNSRVYGRAQGLTLKDDLTSAYNRRYFEGYLKEEINRAMRFKSKLALTFLDLDNLRHVNDEFGHFMGSRALMEAAHRIMDSVRNIDKVVRFGGDEFCVVLPETDLEGVLIVARRIQKKMTAKKFLLHDVPGGVRLSASMGVAIYPDHASTAEDLVKRADEAMYRVKLHGKGAISVAGDGKPGFRAAAKGRAAGMP